MKEYNFLQAFAYRFRELDCGWNMKFTRAHIVTETTDGGTKKIVRKNEACRLFFAEMPLKTIQFYSIL